MGLVTYGYNASHVIFVVDGKEFKMDEIDVNVTPIEEFCDGKKDTNPKDGAATNRLDISLFPATGVIYGALAMMEGHCKYGGYNWREAGVLSSVYYAAIQRHLMKWFNGEWEDPNTGVPHLASVLAGAAILVDAIECNMLKDDRPPAAPMRALLEEMEQKVADLRAKYPNGPRRATNYYDEEVAGDE